MRHSGLLLIAGLQLLAGCATAGFAPSPVVQAPFLERASVQTQATVRVAAAVPDADETRQLIGLDLYALGIQPVWLQVTNLGDLPARAAIHSIDEEYFSPMEVAWKFRNKFHKQGRADMERWFYENQLPRRIPPGESREGFVFTHTANGSKGFNVDIYASEKSFNFTFFIRMPGFFADHMDVDFDALYDANQIQVVDIEGLREVIAALPCCSTDESGNAAGDPINVAIAGTKIGMRRSLLRARWQETAANDPETAVARTHRFDGRPPDGTFHKSRPDGTERKELRLWLSPFLFEDMPVWIGQVSYDMSGATGKSAFKKYRIDADVDDARMYLLQNFWYSQSLAAMGFVGGVPPTTITAPSRNFAGAEYFSDGLRVVLFVSEVPVAMDETDVLPWEQISLE